MLMGLSVHYRGQLKKANSLLQLIEEVVDIAKTEYWRYFVFEDQFPNNSFSELVHPENLYGIMISPPESEPLCFSFLENGRMCGIINFQVLQLDGNSDEMQFYSVSTKTQYAGSEIHKKLILLLDYINYNYLVDFECNDEGQFWETRDEKLLEQIFERYTNLISSFTDVLTIFPITKDESIEAFCIRMAEITHKKDKENGA